MEIEEKSVETSYGKIWYLEAGTGSKVFYFFHGFWGDPRGINGVSSILIPKGYKIIAPYLPGHGKSHSLQFKFDFQDFLLEMEEFVKLTSGNLRIVLFGNSFGGGLAINLARRLKTEGIIVSVPLLQSIKLDDYPRAIWEISKDRIFDGLAAFSLKKDKRLTYFAELPKMKKRWLRDLISGVRLIKDFSLDKGYKLQTKSVIIRGNKDWVSRNYKKYNFDKHVALSGGHYYFLRQYDKFFKELRESI